jgi:hypothetical protein
MQRAYVILSSVACPVLQYFPLYLLNGAIFEKKSYTENKMSVLIFSTNFVLNVSHSEKKRVRYDEGFSRKVPGIPVRF